MTWYSILHGPEIWLAIVALCGCGVLAILVSFAAFSRIESEDEDDKHD